MADQTKNLILKLKLETDASSGQTIVKLIKEQVGAVAEVAKASEKLIQIDTSRRAILQGHLDQVKLIDAAIKAQLDKQAQPLKDLSARLIKDNATIAAQGRGWNFVEKAIEAAVKNHNKYQQALDKEVATQLEIYRIQRLQAVEQVAKAKSYSLTGAATGTTTPASRPTGGFSYGTGVTTDLVARNLETIRKFNEATRIEQEAANRRNLEIVRNFNAATGAIEQEAENRRRFHLTAETNAARIATAAQVDMYRTMFDRIEARASSFGTRMASGSAGSSMIGGMTAAARLNVPNVSSLPSIPSVPEEVINSHRSLFIRVGEAIGAYRIWNTAINLVTSSLKAIPRIGIELESTIASLTATTNSAAGMGSVMVALNKEADRTGISITTLRETFRGFQASTSLAGESMESTWHMFTNLNTVITGLHLPSEKASGIFLAMAQIFNKTKVQSEELVKQLGNLLPGAFASFAAANNVAFGGQFKNSIDLINQMKKGMVFAHDTVERFTEFLANRFAPAFTLASQGLNANIGRMNTSFTLLGEAIYNSTSGPMLTVVKSLTDIGNYLTQGVEKGNALTETLKVLTDVALAGLIVGLGQATIAFFSTTVAIDAMGVSTVTASGAMRLLQGAIAFFSAPVAIIAGITAIGIALFNTSQEAKALEDRINAVRDAELNKQKAITPELKLQFSIEEDPSVKKAKNDLELITASLDELKRTQVKGAGLIDNTKEFERQSTLRLNAELNLQSAIGAAETAFELKQVGESQALVEAKEKSRLDVHIAYLDKIRTADAQAEKAGLEFDRQHAASKADLENAVALSKKPGASGLQLEEADKDSKLLVELETARARAITSARETFDKKSIAQVKIAGAEERRERRDNYKDIIRDSKDATLAIEDDLLRLDYARQDQVMSVQDFYNQKKALQDKDYQQQVASTNRLLTIAKSSGDNASIEKYNDLLREKAQAQVKLEEIGKRTYVVESRAYALQLIDNKAKDASNKLVTESDNINNRYLSGLTTEADYITQVTVLKLKEIEIIKEKNRGLQEQLMLQGELAQSPLEKIKLRQDIETNKAQILAKAAPSGLGKDITTRFGTTGLGSFATASLKASAEQSTLESDKQLALGAVTLDPNMQALEAHKKFTADKQKINEDYATKGRLLNLDYYAGTASMAATAAESMTTMAIKAYGAQSGQAKLAFTAYKALKIAEIMMDTASLATRLALSAASIPIVGAAMAAAAVPIAYAMGAVQIGMVMATPMPAAHGGMTNVPSEQTYLLDKGERVLSPNQNKDFTNFLKGNKKESGQTGGNVYNVAVTVQATKDQNPADLGNTISMSIMRGIAKEEIATASRPGNSLNKTTSFG